MPPCKHNDSRHCKATVLDLPTQPMRGRLALAPLDRLAGRARSAAGVFGICPT